MRNNLLGYLVGALESDEELQIERALSGNEQLQSELETLSKSLAPLECDYGHCNPPRGLVERTIGFVISHAGLKARVPAAMADAVQLPPANWIDRPVATRRWRMADVSVAAGILVAGLAVVIPAIMQSHINAQRLACQERLEQTYAGATRYAGLHKGLLPMATPVAGYQGKAGVYASVLRDGGFIDEDDAVVCPATQIESDQFTIPPLSRLRAATDSELEQLMRRMDGSFASALGYLENGEYHSPKLHRQADFPLLADLPGKDGKPVGHHGGCGSNVLTADGRVFYINVHCWPGTKDYIFTNDDGEQDAGNGKHDSVLVPAWVGLRLR